MLLSIWGHEDHLWDARSHSGVPLSIWGHQDLFWSTIAYPGASGCVLGIQTHFGVPGVPNSILRCQVLGYQDPSGGGQHPGFAGFGGRIGFWGGGGNFGLGGVKDFGLSGVSYGAVLGIVPPPPPFPLLGGEFISGEAGEDLGRPYLFVGYGFHSLSAGDTCCPHRTSHPN